MSKTDQIVAHVNKELKRKFKMECLKNGESQKDAINRLAQYYVDTNGKLQSK